MIRIVVKRFSSVNYINVICILYHYLGNQCFSLNEYKKAIIEYSKGLSFLKGLPGRKEGLEGVSKIAMDSSLDEKITPELEVIVIDLEVILKTNIATCYIKLENGRKALDIIKEGIVLVLLSLYITYIGVTNYIYTNIYNTYSYQI